MSTDLIDSLLADIPAEEVRDERIGSYDSAILAKDVTVSTKVSEDGVTQYSLVAEFQLENDRGTHKITSFIRLPEAGLNDDKANSFFKNSLLRWLHAFGLIPTTNKNTPVLPSGDEETRAQFAAKIAAIFSTKVGESVAISVAENKMGYVNVNPGKAKKAA